MDPLPAGAASRCAVHPGRPALDGCPTCGRPRCARDAAEMGAGCLSCRGRAKRVIRPAGPAEQVVRGALAAFVAALVGGWVSSQYVQTRFFSVLIPGLVGVACGGAALAAARPSRQTLVAIRVTAVVFALVGTAAGFRFVVGAESPFTPAGRVLPPYAAAVVGAWVWTRPVRPRRPARGSGHERLGEEPDVGGRG